jgi:flagellar assembly factor FliW
MKMDTTRFGEIEIVDEFVFDFVGPIIGFDDYKKYILLDYDENSCFKWLQSMDNPNLAFPVTAASFFNIDYQFEISDENADSIELKGAEELLVLNIATIPSQNPEKTTLNLRAPVIVNTSNNKAMQIILSNDIFKIKHPIFEKQEKEVEAGILKD